MSTTVNYKVRVTLTDGRSWTDEFPLGEELPPDDEVLDRIDYMFMEGNYSCDCSKHRFLEWAAGVPEELIEDIDCGDALEIKELIAIRPDGSEVNIV